MDRRGFLGTLGAAAWTEHVARLYPAGAARTLIRNGGIGRVAFCRVSSAEWLRLAREVCGEARLIGEVDPAGVPCVSGAVFLGSQATLVVDRKGCRLLP